VATLARLRRQGTLAVAATRRRGHQSACVFLGSPLGAWQPTLRVEAVYFLSHLVDCRRDPTGSRLINVTGTIELVKLLLAGGNLCTLPVDQPGL
jgi:hypothetical protein